MEKWKFYGLSIGKESYNKLIDILVDYHWIDTLNDSEKEYLDYCILLNKHQASTPSGHPQMCFLNSLIKRGFTEYKIKVDAIGVSNKAMAFRVVLYRSGKPKIHSYNEKAYITICTFNGGKPSDINNITKWYSLDEIIEIETTLKKV